MTLISGNKDTDVFQALTPTDLRTTSTADVNAHKKTLRAKSTSLYIRQSRRSSDVMPRQRTENGEDQGGSLVQCGE